MMETQQIALSKLVLNTGQIPGLPANPRTWTADDVDSIARSLEQTPELFEARPIIAVPYEGKLVILAGSLRFCGAKKAKMNKVPVYVLPEDMTPDKMQEIVIKDNGSFGAWDFDALANEWDDNPLTEWGVPAWDVEPAERDARKEDTTEDEIERKKREFEEKMQAGEISEEDPEYQEFLEKFKLKKTTDDCYTPDIVYEAVADWVAKEYNLDRSNFVRPFYPGGDYQNEKYSATDIVVDNPPFSIMSEIIRFYTERGIRFFLFAPHLTLFSAAASAVTALCVGVGVTYENGAVVGTSFLTNLGDTTIRAKSSPSLYWTVKEADNRARKERAVKIPRYSYDMHIIMAPMLGQLSRLDFEFEIPRTESELISGLDSQKEYGKAIYGKGLIMSDRLLEERERIEHERIERERMERERIERERIEREQMERENAIVWELSEREREIIKTLSTNKAQ